VLTNSHSLLDKHVKVFRDLGSESIGLEDANNLLTGDGVDLGNAMRITKDYTNLGRSKTLLGKLADVLFNV
jgi:hypothetical protein